MSIPGNGSESPRVLGPDTDGASVARRVRGVTATSVRVRWGLAAVAMLALVGAFAYNLVQSQQSARASLEVEFGRRAALAARLTASALNSNSSQWAASFGGPERGVPNALRAWEAGGTPDPQAAVFAATGRLLAAWPDRSAGVSLSRRPEVRRALLGKAGFSNVRFVGGDSKPLITLTAPFKSKYGRRVVAYTTDAAVIEQFASAYLASAPAVQGATAHLIDGEGIVLASSTIDQGRPLNDRVLLAAIKDRHVGTTGERAFASATLPGTPWRVVFSARRSALLAPVEGSTRQTTWELLIAFALALLGGLAAAASAMRKGSQLSDARQREASARQLAHERLHDALTGLPNRALFLDRVEHALARGRRNHRPVAVLFIDLDRFKRINDSLGHAAGDQLLAAVGERFTEVLRPGDTVSRFGGDEFLVLCEALADAEDVSRIATRVRAALDRPFELGGRLVHISCCIGVAIGEPTVASLPAASLVGDADVAMYGAKAEGPGQVRVFDSELHDKAVRRLDTEVALRRAIGAGELCVFYQPIVELPRGELRAVEALVRWQRPGFGLVPPAEFIALAEECGLIDQVGGFVLQTAMAQVARWHESGMVRDDFALSVNVSGHQLGGTELLPLVTRLVDDWKLPPESLWLEMTESTMAADPRKAQEMATALTALGVRVAIDDFGVGQTSLEQLASSLPVNILKLDRSFVSAMDAPRQHSIVAAVAPIARALEMTVIAEGVETSEQADELLRLGYRLVQGYHFGRPMDVGSLEILAGSPESRQTTKPAGGLPDRRPDDFSHELETSGAASKDRATSGPLP